MNRKRFRVVLEQVRSVLVIPRKFRVGSSVAREIVVSEDAQWSHEPVDWKPLQSALETTDDILLEGRVGLPIQRRFTLCEVVFENLPAVLGGAGRRRIGSHHKTARCRKQDVSITAVVLSHDVVLR